MTLLTFTEQCNADKVPNVARLRSRSHTQNERYCTVRWPGDRRNALCTCAALLANEGRKHKAQRGYVDGAVSGSKTNTHVYDAMLRARVR